MGRRRLLSLSHGPPKNKISNIISHPCHGPHDHILSFRKPGRLPSLPSIVITILQSMYSAFSSHTSQGVREAQQHHTIASKTVTVFPFNEISFQNISFRTT